MPDSLLKRQYQEPDFWGKASKDPKDIRAVLDVYSEKIHLKFLKKLWQNGSPQSCGEPIWYWTRFHSYYSKPYQWPGAGGMYRGWAPKVSAISLSDISASSLPAATEAPAPNKAALELPGVVTLEKVDSSKALSCTWTPPSQFAEAVPSGSSSSLHKLKAFWFLQKNLIKNSIPAFLQEKNALLYLKCQLLLY